MDSGESVSNECPRCGAPARVVTAVTLVSVASDPRTVVVTRHCEAEGCHHKYVVLKPESELLPEERRLWRNP